MSSEQNGVNPGEVRSVVVTKGEVEIDERRGLCSLEVNKLKVYDGYPRINPDNNIKGLSKSIERKGQLDPVQVTKDTKNPGYYIVVDGWRRVLAAKMLGWKEIECHLKEDMDGRAQVEFSVVKNVNRKSWTDIEIAKSIKYLKEEFGYTSEEIYILSGVSSSRQSQLDKLLTLERSIQDDVQNGKIRSTTAIAIAGLDSHEHQKRLATQVKKHGYSSQQVKNRVENLKIRLNAQNENREKKQGHKDEGVEMPGIYMKDSRDMSEIEDGSVHLVLTSPPYGMGKEFEQGFSPETIFEENKPVLDESVRKMCQGGILVLNIINVQNHEKKRGKSIYKEWLYNGVRYQNYLRKKGLILRDVVTWYKPNLNWAHSTDKFPVEDKPHTSYRFAHQTEEILVFKKKGERDILPEKEIQVASHLTDDEYKEYGQNLWSINILRRYKKHPCEYPEELCRRVIKMFSFLGDVVLDPFLGSGTTVKVARELDREGIGYEKDLKYKPVIMEKLGVAKKGSALKEYMDEQVAMTAAKPISKAEQEYQEYEPDLPTKPVKSEDRSADKTSASA